MSHLKVPVNANDHLFGNPKAPIILVEYGDYQCPSCGFAFPYINRLMKQFYGELCYVFRHFPLQSVHPYAMRAALAAEAAGKQQRFWEMHNLIYENQDDLDENNLMYYAELLKLDLQRFVQDCNHADLQLKIEADLESGIRSGVNGTPTFFINGVRLDSYDDSYESLAYAIESIK